MLRSYLTDQDGQSHLTLINTCNRANVVHGLGRRKPFVGLGVTSEGVAVLRAAVAIEPDLMALMDWYMNEKIVELSELTAEKLVEAGRSRDVITFLESIRNGARS